MRTFASFGCLAFAFVCGCAQAGAPGLGRGDGSPGFPALDLTASRDGSRGGEDLAVTIDAAAAAPPDLAVAVDLAMVCTPMSCQAPNPLCDPDSGRCVPCLPQNDLCPKDAMCVPVMGGGYRCAGQCAVDKDCPVQASDGGAAPKPACCQLRCVDVANDPQSCGACGKSCGNASCCNGACIDTSKDLMNCGACGRGCGGGKANWACANSACAITGCQAGYGDCNMNPMDGCETSFNTDTANCGGCGMMCMAQNGQVACNGACIIKQCDPGFADCNKSAADGCEASLSSAQNCGVCGKSCPAPPNANATCTQGMCGLAGCLPGFADCDKVANNGCEVAVASDLRNCGACGNVCAAANGTPGCMNGACTVAGCNAPFGDCNKNVGDGCETSTLDDVLHCGACGKKCSLPNATPRCQNGSCRIALCNAPYQDCNNNNADGCEANLMTDALNCGNCGNACANGGKCSNGGCQVVMQFVGAYSLGEGPAWGGNPLTYSCQEACAVRFGGAAGQYACSTVGNQINRSAWVDGYADLVHCPAAQGGGNVPVADTYRLNTRYNCGVRGCAYSAWVRDNCPNAINYCFR